MNRKQGEDRWARTMALVVIGGILAGCDSGKTMENAHLKPGAGREEAMKKMAAAARETYAGIVEIEEVRPRSPEFLDLKLTWSERLAEARAMAREYVTTGPDPYQDHLERIRKMMPSTNGELDGGWRGRMEFFDYALAEAQFEVKKREQGPAGWPALNSVKMATAKRMAADAREVFAAMVEAVPRRAETPEIIETVIRWSRRIAEAEGDATGTPEGRRAAMQAHRDRIKALAEASLKGTTDGGSGVVRLLSDYALAEADYRLEMGADNTEKSIAKQAAAAEKMAGGGDAVSKELDWMWEVRSKTPEFLELRLSYLQRVAEAGMMLHPTGSERRRVVEAYLQRAAAMRKEIETRIKIDVPAMEVAQAEYAMALGEYWGASGE